MRQCLCNDCAFLSRNDYPPLSFSHFYACLDIYFSNGYDFYCGCAQLN